MTTRTAELITIATPVGPFSMIFVPEGVLASGFTTDTGRLLGLIHPRLRPASLATTSGGEGHRDAVAEYLDGRLDALERVPLFIEGGPFLARAWRELRAVPPGETISYGQLAVRAGNPRAIRAAGQACARNPVTLFVPCHRAVRSDGALHNFGWGLEVKRWLVAHEAGQRELAV
jgi:methylated-DNA-[protein]-cysteine S-methyltransferase